MVRLPRNEKQTHRLNSRPQMWPSGLTLTMTLTLTFQGQIWNLLYLSQKWCDCHKTKSKHIDWCQGLKCDHRVWPWPWPCPWIFKVKCGICYISPKNGPIATKLKADISIETWDSNVWPSDLTLAITLTLNFQSQIWNLLYLNEKWSDCYERKSEISIELPASNVTSGLDLDHDLDIWIFKVKCDLDHLVTKVRRKDLPNRDRGDFRCRRVVDSSG